MFLDETGFVHVCFFFIYFMTQFAKRLKNKFAARPSIFLDCSGAKLLFSQNYLPMLLCALGL